MELLVPLVPGPPGCCHVPSLMIMDRTSEPVSQPQLNAVCIRVALVKVSVRSSKILTKTVCECECVCVYTVSVLVHMDICAQCLPWLFSTLVFETESLTKPTAHSAHSAVLAGCDFQSLAVFPVLKLLLPLDFSHEFWASISFLVQHFLLFISSIMSLIILPLCTFLG
jgi:hypothetical protein